MSFADWVNESKHRYRTQPATTATSNSARKFVDGAVASLYWAVMEKLSPVYTTTLTDEKVHFLVDSRKEMKRARNAIGEVPVLEWIIGGIDDDTVFWDVGAYHGTFSVIAAAHGAKVAAFEPFPDNMTRLKRNAALNDIAIEEYNVALSDEQATKAFDVGGPNSELRIDEQGEIMVETIQGDDIGPRPDVIKIDVEGHEEAVLSGMTDHLRFAQRIIVEVHDGVRPADISQQLEDAGLSTTEIETVRSQTYIGGKRE